MSLRKTGRKTQPELGKQLPAPVVQLAKARKLDFAGVIAATLRETYGGNGAAVKTVMGQTGAGERAVRNWLEGKNGPNGSNLVELARNSDQVFEVFLIMAGREDVLTSKKLLDARRHLTEMLRLVEMVVCEGDE